MFRKILRKKQALEDSLYEQVACELADDKIVQGIWLKAIVESGADEFKAKALYTKLRVKQIRRQMEEGHEAPAQESEQRKKEQQPRIKGAIICPNCNTDVIPLDKPRGKIWIGLLLCLLYVVPGLIYFLLMSGYKKECPKCGYTISRRFT